MRNFRRNIQLLVKFSHSSNNSKERRGSSSFRIISFNAVATALAGTSNKRRSYDGSIKHHMIFIEQIFLILPSDNLLITNST